MARGVVQIRVRGRIGYDGSQIVEATVEVAGAVWAFVKLTTPTEEQWRDLLPTLRDRFRKQVQARAAVRRAPTFTPSWHRPKFAGLGRA